MRSSEGGIEDDKGGIMTNENEWMKKGCLPLMGT